MRRAERQFDQNRGRQTQKMRSPLQSGPFLLALKDRELLAQCEILEAEFALIAEDSCSNQQSHRSPSHDRLRLLISQAKSPVFRPLLVIL